VVANVTDTLAIRQILEHLDPSPLEKPPPDIRDVVRVPVDDEGRQFETLDPSRGHADRTALGGSASLG
jgi:hypothetical protein